MINNICFWLKNSRLFSLPMTILSWFVIFTYCIKSHGDILNGVLALIGIACGQLATNLFDDYIDYQKIKAENAQVCKCAYIREVKATINDVLKVVGIYSAIALLAGFIILLRTGLPVIWLALIGGIIVLAYPKLSQLGFSEVAVAIAFGPLLFEGVHYVMLKEFSFDILFLALAVVMFTVGLMYVHTVLDYEGDKVSHKRTLVCRLGTKERAINGVWVVYGLGYLFTVILALIWHNYFLFVTFALLPLIFNMWNSLKSYTCGGEEKEFYFRLLKARNLMVYYSVLVILCLMIF